MAQQIITFDPDVGVPMGVNLTMFSGADFNTTFTIRTSAGSSIDFTNYTGRSNMKKSAIGTAKHFWCITWRHRWKNNSIYGFNCNQKFS